MTRNKYWKKKIRQVQHIPSLFFLLKYAMRINLAAILHVKIAWSRASKQLVPRTDAYKMA